MAEGKALTVPPDSKRGRRLSAIEAIKKAGGEEKLKTLKLEDVEKPSEGEQKVGAESRLKTLNLEDLEERPKEAQDAPADSDKPTYMCTTQRIKPGSVASIVVGLFGVTPRWKPGSTINYATSAEGYPSQEDAVYAARALKEAADEWNSHKVGVEFSWVNNLEDAAFVLAYGGNNGNVLASAFFPDSRNPLEALYVFSYAFDKTVRPGGWTNYGIMKDVFLHELGHVLGLRHEFALDRDERLFEGGAVRWASANPYSIMSYNFPPKIQESDIEDTRSFYNIPVVVDYVPDN